jgi:hypothetical protein
MTLTRRRVSPLCRYRHNGDYAESVIMPRIRLGAGFSLAGCLCLRIYAA